MPAAAAILARLLLLLRLLRLADANAGVFTYYEDPFRAPGSSEIIRAGPSTWRDLLIPGNQCGGQVRQTTGYGQSPIVIPREVTGTCDTDLGGYEFKAATCTYADLNFRIVTNGVIVGPHFGNDCSMGRMKIPGVSQWYDVLQFHVHTNSEHSVAGKYKKYYPAELHVVHRREDGGDFAVFGSFIDDYDVEEGAPADDEEDVGRHETFEWFLKGWEARAHQTDEVCAAQKEGTGVFTANRLFRSRQQLIQCPAIAADISEDDVSNLEWYEELTVGPPPVFLRQTHWVPVVKSPDFPSGPIPNIYSADGGLPTKSDFGIYTYRGGLTTPPCTEIVRWNLLDSPMIISPGQLDRLYGLILCFVERSSCTHATVASQFGGTNRPPQNLYGRKVTHRCAAPSGNTTAADGGVFDDPVPEAVILEDPVPAPVPSELVIKPWWQLGFVQPYWAILFPWFNIAIGIVSYFLLTRYAHALPYTAVLFVVGTFMGIGISDKFIVNSDQLTSSIRMWSSINSEVLLLVFLPGLLFKDAFGLDVYLLKDAIGQCLVMAFPMVLAGTCLMALVGYYILPYGWSFNLSMTFGAILSATDPVAVCALLNEVGAPPRLRMHIAGEALLNDGSAMVFFFIFSQMFLYELQILGLGQDIGVGEGFAIFFKMSLGAVGIGLAFGLGLVSVLRFLNRRFNGEEAVVQVASTVTVAYLVYYVAESVVRGSGQTPGQGGQVGTLYVPCSGVLAVVTTGVVAKSFGERLIVDKAMMDKAWHLIEFLLNTVLFVLGGVVWGTVVSNSDPRRIEDFTGKDWGYLFLVYVLAMVVRFFLFGSFYPILSRIGLGTNPKESFFAAFGGLRGAVGIALAIALDNELRSDTFPGNPARAYTSQLFGLTGGVALLTLIINGMACGPILRKLGLARSTDTRAKIVERYHERVKEGLLNKLLKYLSHPWYCEADVGIVLRHVPALAEITFHDVKAGVRRLKAESPAVEYVKPNLKAFGAALSPSELEELEKEASVSASDKLRSMVKEYKDRASAVDSDHPGSEGREEELDEKTLIELRKSFIELLKHSYQRLVEKGEVDVRNGLVVFTLEKSLEYALDKVHNGEELCDWEELQGLANPRIVQKLMEYAGKPGGYFFGKLCKKTDNRSERFAKAKSAQGSILGKFEEGTQSSIHHVAQKLHVDELLGENANKDTAKDVERTISFIEAHLKAQRMFKHGFCSRILSRTEQKVLEESQKQVEAARAMLQSKDPILLRTVISLQLSTVLLNGAAILIEGFVDEGLLTEREGEEYMKRERIEHELVVVGESIREECSKKTLMPAPSNAEVDTGVAVGVGKGSNDDTGVAVDVGKGSTDESV